MGWNSIAGPPSQAVVGLGLEEAWFLLEPVSAEMREMLSPCEPAVEGHSVRRGGVVSVLLSLKETGCSISYFSVNILFCKKLEAERCLPKQGWTCVCLFLFFPWAGVTDS